MPGRHVAIRAPYRRGVVRRPSLLARLRSWFVQADPAPKYSRVDRLDGLGGAR